MKSHRSLIWRASLIYAAVTLATLAVMGYFLADNLRNQAEIRLAERQEREIRLAATTVAPYLANPDSPANRQALYELSRILAALVDTPVTLYSAHGTPLAVSHGSLESVDNLVGIREPAEVRRDDLYRQAAVNGNVLPGSLTAPVFAGAEVVGFVSLATPRHQGVNGLAVLFVSLGFWGIVSGGLAILLGCMAARYFSRSTESVQAVTRASRQLAQGDYDHRVPAGVYHETRQLTGAYNRMADAVKGVIGGLSSERDTLSAVLATMADGVTVIDTSGRVTLLNPAARDLLGIRAQQIEELRFVELVRDNEIHQAITRCHEENSRQQADVSLILPLRYLSVIATPLDNNGGVLLTLHDLTRMRQVETSQKEFVSNVSHELRNPMASIKAMVETLESGAVNDPNVALDFLGRMRADVDRINGLVNDLLELSRMESGQFGIDTEPIALIPVVQSVEKQFSAAAAARDVRLVNRIKNNLPPVMADGEKLNQVFVNLVENALKFTPGGGEISISADAVDDYVQVLLKDTGIGVAPQHLPHIFERFYKVNRSRRDGGIGLGLSIVKQLVEAHGGQISVESQEGEGCAFTFTIPRA